jgi:hypothetical protein
VTVEKLPSPEPYDVPFMPLLQNFDDNMKIKGINKIENSTTIT